MGLFHSDSAGTMTSRSGWGDAHGLALVFGGVLACILGGFVVFAVDGARRIDWIGKGLVDTAAVIGLMAAQLRRGS